MPKTLDDSWPAGMAMLVRVDVTRAARAQLRIAHDTQDARQIRVPHIDNSHPNATANDSQMITRYRHTPDRMREALVQALQARWEDSVRARAAIRPHSPVTLLDELLAPTAATRRTQHPPTAPSGT